MTAVRPLLVALFAVAACAGNAPVRQPEEGAAGEDGNAGETAMSDASTMDLRDTHTTGEPALGDASDAMASEMAEGGLGPARFVYRSKDGKS